jgi:hypothetical protein
MTSGMLKRQHGNKAARYLGSAMGHGIVLNAQRRGRWPPVHSEGNMMKDHELNAGVFQALREAGTDFKLPHLIEHVFRGPRQDTDRLRDQLARSGLDLAYEADGMGPLILKEWMELDLERMNERTAALARIARAFACEYDGWSTAIRRPVAVAVERRH